ncbi:MAG TPA: MlaD family protein [Sporichthya sp.]|nr:MlaD family protein [Sporichthya sp.]
MAGLRRRGTLIANLAVLLVLFVGVYHVGINVLRLPIGRHPFTVHVELTEAGGIYPRSEVNYRGKLIGRVTDVRLRPGGVVADLRLDEGTKVPSDTDAVVSNLSAAGEQFVDLRPRRADGPILRAGDVIPVERTAIPISTAAVVRDVTKLLDQVSSDDLATVVDELAKALDGSGGELGRLIDSSTALVDSLQASLPETLRLLGNARTNLDTANALSGDFEVFTSQLRKLSRELRKTDAPVRGLLDTGPGAITDIDAFVHAITSPVGALLANLVVPGDLITARLPALQALVIAFPQATGALKTTAQGGKLNIDLHLTSNPTCNYGGPRRTPVDPTRVEPNLKRICTSRLPGVQARGSQNAPKPSPSGPGTPGYPAVALGYDPQTGLLVLPDGQRFTLGPVRTSGSMTAVLALLLALVQG